MHPMKFTSIAIVLLLINQCISDDDVDIPSLADGASFYTAAVVELYAPGNELTVPEEIVEANLAEYLKLIYEASEKGVDILVFPEATLNYYGINSYENLTEMAVDVQVDVPDISDCDFTHDDILGELSFAAANASIYVLVNVVELEPCNDTDKSCKNNYKLFNTNLVFDRKGCIISRYRKYNLYLEPFMSITDEPEMQTFETDFGVTFGHFICFDILFKSPALDLIRKANVSHILYPSMWFSSTPYAVSIQLQQAFAQRNNIALLSAGGNWPIKGNTGSGIFIGRHGAVEKFISYKNETRMIIAEIPKNLNDPDYQTPEPTIEPYDPEEMKALKIVLANSAETHPLSHHFVITENNVTCEFTLNYTTIDNPDGFTHQFMVFSGSKDVSGILKMGQIQCAIISCEDEGNCGSRHGNKTPRIKFHEIRIEMSVKDDGAEYFFMPSTLVNTLHPMEVDNYDFKSHEANHMQEYSMSSMNITQDLLTFGIYGRHFSLDQMLSQKIENSWSVESESEEEKDVEETPEPMEDDEVDDDFELKMIIYVVLMVVLCIITAIMVHRKLQDPYKPDLSKRRSSSK